MVGKHLFSTQTAINACEYQLKNEFGYTKQDLEKLGLLCINSEHYLDMLLDEIDKQVAFESERLKEIED